MSLPRLFAEFKEKMIEVDIIPQADGRWMVEISVPSIWDDGRDRKHWFDKNIANALAKALKEYNKRDKARDVLK